MWGFIYKNMTLLSFRSLENFKFALLSKFLGFLGIWNPVAYKILLFSRDFKSWIPDSSLFQKKFKVNFFRKPASGMTISRSSYYLKMLIVILYLSLQMQSASAEEILVPRTIIALYDGKTTDSDSTNIHTLVEMPLNHLGLKVEYYDVQKPLPDITKRADVRGVLTWLFYETKMDNPETYLKWASDVVNAGKKYVILGTLGVNGAKNKPTAAQVNIFMGKLGIKMTNGWTETAFDVEYI